MQRQKVTVEEILAHKGRRIVAALTAYDYPMARLLDEAGIPVLLVGDSLGMVVLGHPDTTHVRMEDMIHHTRAVARAKPSALVGADLPYLAYRNPMEARENAQRLVDAGAEFVKAEGGQEIIPQIDAIRSAGIPFCGHLGMLPQHVLEEGGKYRVKGRDEAGRQRLLEDATALEAHGCFATVLELVAPSVTAEITQTCHRMLTIGIGSGPACDGQILVTQDLVGAFPWFTPKFVIPGEHIGQRVRDTAASWAASLNPQ
jgi:3-methyl-2-oxobutanoate hydroxymethyltransferase